MPFEPTGVGGEGDIPAVCWCCGRHAVGVGVGQKKWGRGDFRWLCEECKELIPELTQASAARLDILELEALNGGVDEVGKYLDQIGVTDLADMDELDARLIVKAAWQGCVRRLRQLIKEES